MLYIVRERYSRLAMSDTCWFTIDSNSVVSKPITTILFNRKKFKTSDLDTKN